MILYSLLIITVLQLVYWWYYYHYSFNKFRENVQPLNDLPPVSVVICFKGLPKDFTSNLNKIICQEYPNFELVLINDFSDESDVIKMREWQKNQTHTSIQWVNASLDKPGKKHALREGVSHCANDLLLFTDMDCHPASQKWIQKMVQTQMNHRADIVLGYSPMEQSKGPIAWFSGFETLLTGMQYLSHFFADTPYMSVGRNWLVKKDVYLDYVDKALGQNLASGDDDLLFQTLVRKQTISACLNKESFMYSLPKTSLISFLRQKTRHITTSVKYPIKVQITLFLFAASFPLFYGLSLGSLLLNPSSYLFILCLVVSKWTLQSIFHYNLIKALNETRYLSTFPLGEIALSFYFPLLGIWSLFSPKKW